MKRMILGDAGIDNSIAYRTRNNATRSTSSTKLKSAQKTSQGCEEVKEATKKILEIMRSVSIHGSTSESEPHEMIDQINNSMTLIATC